MIEDRSKNIIPFFLISCFFTLSNKILKLKFINKQTIQTFNYIYNFKFFLK